MRRRFALANWRVQTVKVKGMIHVAVFMGHVDIYLEELNFLRHSPMKETDEDIFAVG